MKYYRLLISACMALPVFSLSLHGRQTETFVSDGNPILSDGSIYSADPAPFVVNDTVYILSGRDEAPPTTNAFIMNEWQLFSAQSPDPAGGEWTLQRAVARPEALFAWADSGGAYASQIIQGADGRFYFFASVTQRDPGTQDAFGIGVAVSDSPTGPFTDAHPDGPIISQAVPVRNDIHNIDPVVLVDDDNRVFVYWGSFNQLRGVELGSDMTTIIGSITAVTSLTGFFEAPWFMKRKETYYMLYAANNAGPDSPCTPTSYHACIAYGTASSPLGPWTFRGVVLPIVSSTTSHPGVYVLADGAHFLVYHTADAEGGGHFRRSIALDPLLFDDAASPPSIRPVERSVRPALSAPRPPSRNVAPLAEPSSVPRTPVQYWLAALHDERVPSTPLPPDYWSAWAGEASPRESVLTYTWDAAVELNGVAVAFFADAPAGSDFGVAPPREWRVEYRAADGAWKDVAAEGPYPNEVTDSPAEVGFATVKTTMLRAVFVGSGNGPYAAVGIKEWFAFAPAPV
ncbi:hypothetical protein D7B24_001411 [Verticillium nonalfalfae]|uniref:Glycosyl hydrolase family 43 protein n=1 Tax=Verticillium nonalfalfae TaxID=1051616 RepID=A0A3M9XZL1_9PEZI|nr:uncharacterized protein D7B24_001411 [Verticillium nonalfalfae]RNJ53719.1 hypothetical protein D7B24_001411 [Verticillium nonalfalfae]